MGAMNFSAQGSITVRRLRTGDVITLSMNSNGKALFQGWDPTAGVETASPNWDPTGTTGAERAAIIAAQPTRTPQLTSAKGRTVTMDDPQWFYNGVLIEWGETTFQADSKTYYVSSNFDGKFAWIASTGEIRIVKNLASPTNTWNDTLTFKCKAVSDNVGYELERELTVEIVSSGASSYRGFVTPLASVLTLDADSTTVNAELKLGVAAVSTFYTKWYAGTTQIGTVITSVNGVASKTIGRSDINGMTLITVEFFIENPSVNAGAQPVAVASTKMTDQGDDFAVMMRYTTNNVEVSDGNPVTVQAYVVKMSDNTEYSLSGKNPTWSLDIMNVQSWTSLANSSTDTITISTTHTDCQTTGDGRVAGEMYDVEVLADVTWNE